MKNKRIAELEALLIEYKDAECRAVKAEGEALKRIRELPFRITDDEPSRIRMEALIEQAIKGEIE